MFSQIQIYQVHLMNAYMNQTYDRLYVRLILNATY